MNSLINKNNYEHTKLENVDFPFKIFFINEIITPSHWHKHTELIFMIRGSASIYINGDLFRCCEGEIAYIPNSSLHTIIPDGNSKYCAILIGDTLFNNVISDIHYKEYVYLFLNNYDIMPFIIYKNLEHYINFKFIIDEIIAETNSKDEAYQLLIKANIFRFFVFVIRFAPYSKIPFDDIKNKNINNFKKIFDFIDNNYQNKITISDMTKLTNFSPQHFCRLFKSYTGKTFVEYVTLIRLENAKDLIVKTNLPITQISSITGFCNANYFDRIFKKYFGAKPSDIRKNTLNVSKRFSTENS